MPESHKSAVTFSVCKARLIPYEPRSPRFKKSIRMIAIIRMLRRVIERERKP